MFCLFLQPLNERVMYRRTQFDELAARRAEPRKMIQVGSGGVPVEEFLQWNISELLSKIVW